MKKCLPYNFLIAFCLPICGVINIAAQKKPILKNAGSPLFENDSILNIRISGAIKNLMRDRGDKAEYFPVTLSYQSDEGLVSIPLKARTRGNFRRKMAGCTYPPIMLNFQKKEAAKTIFDYQDKLKLTLPCRGEEFVVREYLVYKMYNLVSPLSFKARLVRISFFDKDRNKESVELGMLLEEDGQMAKRNGMKVFNDEKVRGERTGTEDFLNVAVFNYMIGNTDWQTDYLHNIRLIATDSNLLRRVVPYDFDHSAFVGAPYAKPAPEFELGSIKERLYRGYCMDKMEKFETVFSYFNKLKPEFYNLIRECKLLDEKTIRLTIEYLDEFYLTINDAKKAKADFLYPCGRQNIIIKGLGE